jgi:hypothetical protein
MIFSCLAACSRYSYPKNEVARAVEKIVSEESHLPSHAELIGKTFYIRISLPELLNSKSEIQKAVLKKLNIVNVAITRVALSTDAKIDYLALIVDLKDWKTTFSVIQRFDDLKSFIYERISRGDYEDRIIYDLSSNGPFDTVRDMTMSEFVAKLIVSKVNWLSATNPFVNAAVGVRLEIDKISADTLVLKTRDDTLNPISHQFVMKLLSEWGDKIAKKYGNANAFSKIEVVNHSEQSIATVMLNK